MAEDREFNSLSGLCQPYIVALKSGDFKKNLLDYQLLLLQRNCLEIVRSPKQQTTLFEANAHLEVSAYLEANALALDEQHREKQKGI